MSSTVPNSFELLKTKEIYAILDGDTKYVNANLKLSHF